ncbi:B-cell lymphoma 3 protein [Bombina bombina]|uniref:B-cell lymphoma 3 protein n=1 Tax=Bombina bombina TaxID=8345 RepID=UPI00235AEA11|nr:B-cell lymphoma 3 protein [Bombina bombina]
METTNSLHTERMETSSPLDLSISRNMDKLNMPRSFLNLIPRVSARVSDSQVEIKQEGTKHPKESERESLEEAEVCKDQACLPFRKRRYPPSPKDEGSLKMKKDQCSECARKCYAPCMTVTLPPLQAYYHGASAAYLSPALPTLPLYPAPVHNTLNGSFTGFLPQQHAALLQHDSQLQADIIAATQSDEDGDTALHIAVAHGNFSAAKKVISLLLHGRRSLDSLNNLRQTPLHLAVITNQPDLVSLLLENGSSPLIPDRNGQTCLHLACEYESSESLEVLLRFKTRNLEATNFQGKTALHVAISTRRKDITCCLLDNGAEVDTVDIKSGHSPLIQAVENGCEDLVSLLLQHGASVNAQTYAGNTALHVASGRGLAEITRLLLRSGADCGIKNCHNDTAMTVAKDRRITDILRGKSSSPHSQNEKCVGSLKDNSFTSSSWGERSQHNSSAPQFCEKATS